MISRFPTALSAVIFTLFSFALNAQTFAVVLDSSEVQSGQIVCIAASAQGFTNIIGYQYSLEFDPAVLTFHHSQQYGLPDMGSANFNLYQPGVLTTAWADPLVAGVSRPNGAILYEVCFTAIGNVGATTTITPGGTLPVTVGSANVYNADGEDLWNPNVNVPGLVEIMQTSATSEAELAGKSAFLLSPNPTQSGSRAVFKSEAAGNATLTVTDASGRLVLDQKTTVRAGENTIEIPAKALTAKGMYQVSLKTEQGISTQMLSVN